MYDTPTAYLIAQTRQFAHIDDDALNALISLFTPQQFAKETHLERPGADKSSLFFMASGLVRYYYLGDDGKEWNKAFVSEGMISTSFTADFLNKPSPYGIQALEESTILIANYSAFEALYDTYPMIERLGRKIIESILIFKMNRERSLLKDSAKVRYAEFVHDNPGLMSRVPQYHIASYLGITEASLSRLLRNHS